MNSILINSTTLLGFHLFAPVIGADESPKLMSLVLAIFFVYIFHSLKWRSKIEEPDPTTASTNRALL